MKRIEINTKIAVFLKELHLPAIKEIYEECSLNAEKGNTGHREYLLELLEAEHTTRCHRRINRYMHESKLPLEKDMATFDMNRMPLNIKRIVDSLLDGSFLKRKENILAFGKPGTGKTHLLCAIAQELVQNGHRIYFTRCSSLVEDLLKAKRDLKLDSILKKLTKYEAIVIDDIGYVQYNREEMEVLFTLLAHRYERGSVMLTSNLQFSKWEKIFKDPMTTAAAIDRLVHHSVILELNLNSYRMEQAKIKKIAKEKK